MKKPTCSSLQERFGSRYRVTLAADRATKAGTPADELPWLFEVRCRFGVVYAYDGEILAASTSSARIGAKLRALPFILHAKGNAEVTIRFHVGHAEDVLRLLKPYRRRQVSEAERERLRAIGTVALEKHRARANIESGETAPESTQRAG
jgi:hypothetical protein